METRTKFWVVGVIILVALGASFLRKKSHETRFDPKVASLVRLEEVRGEGMDLSKGPCLGLVGPDWVADITHDPRQPVDDDPANQCAEYRTGKVKHFVELTAQGKVMKVR